MSIFLGGIGAVSSIIKAKSKINQKNIDKAIEYDVIADKLNDEMQDAYNIGNERLEKQLEKKYYAAYEKYLNYLYALPKTEQKRVEQYTRKTKYK